MENKLHQNEGLEMECKNGFILKRKKKIVVQQKLIVCSLRNEPCALLYSLGKLTVTDRSSDEAEEGYANSLPVNACFFLIHFKNQEGLGELNTGWKAAVVKRPSQSWQVRTRLLLALVVAVFMSEQNQVQNVTVWLWQHSCRPALLKVRL